MVPRRRLFAHTRLPASLAIAAALTCAVGSSVCSSVARAAPELARRSEDLVESVGVNIPVGNVDAADMISLGVRHYRASLQVTPAASINDAFTRYGLRGMFLGSGNQNPTMAAEVAAVKALDPGAIEFFEGPNEVNNTFGSCNCNFKYSAQQDAAAAIVYMNDLHAAFQADPALAKIPILSFTQVSFLPNYNGQLAGLFPYDIENFHPYPAYGPVNYGLYGQTATLDLAGNQYGSLGYNHKAADAEQIGDAGAPRPIIASETGYLQSTYGPVDQGKYVSYMFADYFKGGLKRAYYFMLTHSGDDFGLMDANGVQLPAWYSLQGLLAALREATWDPKGQTWVYPSFQPETLDLTLTPQGDAGIADQLDHLVLERSDGDFFVLLWNEVLAYEVNTKKELTNAPLPVELTVTSPSFVGATVSTRDDAKGTYTAVAAALTNGALTLQVPDSLLIVQLHRAHLASPDGGLDGAAGGTADGGAGLDAGSGGDGAVNDAPAEAAPTGSGGSGSSGGCSCRLSEEGGAGWSAGGIPMILLAGASWLRRRERASEGVTALAGVTAR